ncbi:MAG: YcjX family protein [Pseudomonadota bacterium]
MAGILDFTDAIGRGIQDAQSGFGELFEPVIRLGVTGLSRAGKTVFITSLVANLLTRGRMAQLSAAREGRILTAYLRPQPNDAVARFEYEQHLLRMTGPDPAWPDSTRTISQLRLSMRVRSKGLLTGLTGPRTVHLDIVDYPGEWLLDLPLLEQSYAEWSRETIALARTAARLGTARPWLTALEAVEPDAPLDEPAAAALAETFRTYLKSARKAGFSAVAPGRFLMPGDLEGSPALTFAPLPRPDKPRSNALYAAFERRFESYKRIVVRPFFRDHFANIERQVVLIDALGAIHAGPQALEDLRQAMAAILACFRPGRNSWLGALLGTRVERILFAATKADHLHHAQHDPLSSITEALLTDARRRAEFRGAETRAMALASLRATVEERVRHGGETLDCVRGVLADTRREAAMYPGELPRDPTVLLAPARQGAPRWLDAEYRVMKFAPPVLSLAPGDGPPHIRLDRAAEFLIGDRLA